MKLSKECVNETETAATDFLANCLLQCFTLLPSLAAAYLPFFTVEREKQILVGKN